MFPARLSIDGGVHFRTVDTLWDDIERLNLFPRILAALDPNILAEVDAYIASAPAFPMTRKRFLQICIEKASAPIVITALECN